MVCFSTRLRFATGSALWLGIVFVATANLHGQTGSPAAPIRDHPYTPQQELDLGRTMLGITLTSARELDVPEAAEYLDRLAAQLTEQFPQLPFPVQLTINASRGIGTTHEPQVLPGGFIVVSSMLFLEARDEDEFAGMLAHAIAHSAARHPSQILPASQTGPVTFTTPEGAPIPVGMTGIQPSDEPVADELAARALVNAGYDPAGLLNYLDRLGEFRRLLANPEPDAVDSRVSALRRVLDELAASRTNQSPADRSSGESNFEAAQKAVFAATGSFQ